MDLTVHRDRRFIQRVKIPSKELFLRLLASGSDVRVIVDVLTFLSAKQQFETQVNLEVVS